MKLQPNGLLVQSIVKMLITNLLARRGSRAVKAPSLLDRTK